MIIKRILFEMKCNVEIVEKETDYISISFIWLSIRNNKEKEKNNNSEPFNET